MQRPSARRSKAPIKRTAGAARKDATDGPTLIGSLLEQKILGTFWAKKTAYKYPAKCLSMHDLSASEGYKGMNMRRHWTHGLGRVSGAGISGKAAWGGLDLTGTCMHAWLAGTKDRLSPTPPTCPCVCGHRDGKYQREGPLSRFLFPQPSYRH